MPRGELPELGPSPRRRGTSDPYPRVARWWDLARMRRRPPERVICVDAEIVREAWRIVVLLSERDAPRRVIRLFPDYARDWPLWENSTPTWDVGYTTNPEMYGLPDELARDMASWNALWESRFDPFDGWDTERNRETRRLQGRDIAARLEREVSSFADVEYEPWPLGDSTD